DDLGFVLELFVEPLPHERIDGREKSSERLARSRRRGEQNMLAILYRRPCFGLRRGRRAELTRKPGFNRWREYGSYCHKTGIESDRGRHNSAARRGAKWGSAGPEQK